MNYIKMFIKHAKKEQIKNSKSDISQKAKDILGDYLENLFDDYEFVEKYFQEFLIYSENFLQEKKNDDLNNLITELSTSAGEINPDHKYEYYKRLFLLDFLASKVDSN